MIKLIEAREILVSILSIIGILLKSFRYNWFRGTRFG